MKRITKGNDMRREKKDRGILTPESFIITGEGLGWDAYTLGIFTANEIEPGAVPTHRIVPDFPLEIIPAERLTEKSERLGMFNGIRLLDNLTSDMVARCRPDKRFLIVDLLRPQWDFNRPENKSRFRDFPQYLVHYCKVMAQALKKYPNVWTCVGGEVDGGAPWMTWKFRDGKEAFRQWKQYLFSPRGIGKRLALLKKHGIDYRRDNVMIHGGELFSLHYFYEWGFRFVWLERGCLQSNQQLGVAFLRGAARQYGRQWGLDFSPHHPQGSQTAWHDVHGRQRGGWSGSLLLRGWLMAFMSGADLVHEEESHYANWIFDAKGNLRLSDIGEKAKRFADFALRRHPTRGRTRTPVALMLNYHHGFDARHGWFMTDPEAWVGRLNFRNAFPFEGGNANISNILEMFFPGHNKSTGTTDKALNPDVPWRCEEEYNEMRKDGLDIRPFEDGQLVPSPYGDCMDVLLDNAGSGTLRNYKIMFLAGRQEWSRTQTHRFLDYVSQGGTLIASMSQLPESLLRKVGVLRKSSSLGMKYDMTRCLEDGEEFGDCRYFYYSKVDVPNGRVLGETQNHAPLIWEVPYGKGRVVVTAVLFSQDAPGVSLLPLCRHLFGNYLDAVVPAKASPEGLELIVNDGPGFALAAAINNGHKTWRGTLSVKKERTTDRLQSVRDIWREEHAMGTDRNGRVTIKATIAPYDLRIFRIRWK
ncbi:MAG: hypothetical protein PHR35_16630 [Kiritimatiellae bacterium]|nr:hypothetical protein [Kiritimatiellia bacterium]